MEASGSEGLTKSERKEEGAPSGQGEDGPKSKKRPADDKAKKRKKARVSRPARPSYTVHQGEDMLLVISNAASQYEGSAWTLKKKGGTKKKVSKGKLKANPIKKKKTVRIKAKRESKAVEEEVDTQLFVDRGEADHSWGQHLPEEVLVNIFQMVVIQDGAVPFLCRYYTTFDLMPAW